MVITIYVLIGCAIVGNIIALVLAAISARKTISIKNQLDNIIHEDNEFIKIMRSARETFSLELLGEEDIEKHVVEMKEQIATAIKHEPKEAPYIKLVVHFFHYPKDVAFATILQSNVRLVDEGYCVLWVYSSSQYRNFPNELRHEMQPKLNEPSEFEERCAFVEMDDYDELLPINFSTAAPLSRSVTVTYVNFVGDNDRRFALRASGPDLFAKKIDDIALRKILDVDVGSFNQGSAWAQIVNHAKERS
jgi:hypothetical protein